MNDLMQLYYSIVYGWDEPDLGLCNLQSFEKLQDIVGFTPYHKQTIKKHQTFQFNNSHFVVSPAVPEKILYLLHTKIGRIWVKTEGEKRFWDFAVTSPQMLTKGILDFS